MAASVSANHLVSGNVFSKKHDFSLLEKSNDHKPEKNLEENTFSLRKIERHKKTTTAAAATTKDYKYKKLQMSRAKSKN